MERRSVRIRKVVHLSLFVATMCFATTSAFLLVQPTTLRSPYTREARPIPRRRILRRRNAAVLKSVAAVVSDRNTRNTTRLTPTSPSTVSSSFPMRSRLRRRKILTVASLVVATASFLLQKEYRRILRSMLTRENFRAALALLVAWNTWAWLAVKRRQRADATSEWSRYARYPAARARALVALFAVSGSHYIMLNTRLVPNFLWHWLSLVMSAFCKHRVNIRTRLLQASGSYLTAGLLQLGPLYIKLGQIISCRPHVLPAQWLVALERLQDQVPAQSGAAALDLAHSAWGNSTRDSFDETFSQFHTDPLAAASLGQVHQAVLRRSGEVVAIKLQRPFLRDMYDQDFSLLTKIAALIDRLSSNNGQKKRSVGSVGGVSQNWTKIFQDAEAILYREIDYRDEAENAVRFCADFGLAKKGQAAKPQALSLDGKVLPTAAPWLRTPYVYQDLSSEKVLVMEFVPSIKITNTRKLRAAGVTAKDKEYLADCLARAYLRQFCCNYFFSADPHPGNLGVEILNLKGTSPEQRVRLVFYDFGQAASLKPMQGEGILDIIDAIVDSDVDRSVESFLKMGILKPDANLDLVRSKVADNFRTGKVKANRKRLSKRGYKFRPQQYNSTSASNTTASGSDDEIMQYFTMPTEYAFVGRALTQMDGVGKSLDADFDFITAAAPWIYEIKGATKYLQEEALKKVGKLFTLFRT